jgi:UDP-glucose 4-epimerase
MRILVTGGAGFIGSNLVRSLAACGEKVRILDDLSTGQVANIEDVTGRVELITGSTTDRELVREALQGCELVYHLAGDSNPVRQPLASPTQVVDEVVGTLTILFAARDTDVRRVVYASSSALYGREPRLPTREDSSVDSDLSFAAVKLACEDYCRAFSREYGIETACLRLYNAFGPREDPFSPSAGAVARFAVRMILGQPPVIFGDGEQTRDFVFVANVVQAFILAGTSPHRLWGEVVNVGSGVRTSLLDLVDEINSLLETDHSPIFGAPWQEDIQHGQADISRAQDLFRYEPLVSLREGLAQTIEWYSQKDHYSRQASSSDRKGQLLMGQTQTDEEERQ